EAKTRIPGFPDPDITRPNIRFQQTRTLPEEMTRTDAMPVKCHRDGGGTYRPVVDPKKGGARQWGLSRLRSRENPLVLFTLCSQMGLGAFALSVLGARAGLARFQAFAASALYVPLALVALMATAFGLFMSTMHLGKPLRFYRGFNNLR